MPSSSFAHVSSAAQEAYAQKAEEDLRLIGEELRKPENYVFKEFSDGKFRIAERGDDEAFAMSGDRVYVGFMSIEKALVDLSEAQLIERDRGIDRDIVDDRRRLAPFVAYRLAEGMPVSDHDLGRFGVQSEDDLKELVRLGAQINISHDGEVTRRGSMLSFDGGENYEMLGGGRQDDEMNAWQFVANAAMRFMKYAFDEPVILAKRLYYGKRQPSLSYWSGHEREKAYGTEVGEYSIEEQKIDRSRKMIWGMGSIPGSLRYNRDDFSYMLGDLAGSFANMFMVSRGLSMVQAMSGVKKTSVKLKNGYATVESKFPISRAVREAIARGKYQGLLDHGSPAFRSMQFHKNHSIPMTMGWKSDSLMVKVYDRAGLPVSQTVLAPGGRPGLGSSMMLGKGHGGTLLQRIGQVPRWTATGIVYGNAWSAAGLFSEKEYDPYEGIFLGGMLGGASAGRGLFRTVQNRLKRKKK